jgi:hypothetical protein
MATVGANRATSIASCAERTAASPHDLPGIIGPKSPKKSNDICQGRDHMVRLHA